MKPGDMTPVKWSFPIWYQLQKFCKYYEPVLCLDSKRGLKTKPAMAEIEQNDMLLAGIYLFKVNNRNTRARCGS